MQPLAKLEGVTKTFIAENGAGVTVLDGISFDLNGGEIVGITGPSGCGKTTLCRIIAGLDTPSSGMVRGGGDAATLVFQDARVFPWRTVAGHFALLPLVAARLDDILDRFRLREYLHRPAWQLSIGTQKRLLIALALLMDRPLLLLDEALASVDVQTRIAVERLIADHVRALKRAAVVVTHDLSELERMADRVILLSSSPARIAGVYSLPRDRDALLKELLGNANA
jgi:NitT/TauT family transport system ATP-binding protein